MKTVMYHCLFEIDKNNLKENVNSAKQMHEFKNCLLGFTKEF